MCGLELFAFLKCICNIVLHAVSVNNFVSFVIVFIFHATQGLSTWICLFQESMLFFVSLTMDKFSQHDKVCPSFKDILYLGVCSNMFNLVVACHVWFS